MSTNTITFYEVVEFAEFCAELQRQGIAFHGESSGGVFKVRLTGY